MLELLSRIKNLTDTIGVLKQNIFSQIILIKHRNLTDTIGVLKLCLYKIIGNKTHNLTDTIGVLKLFSSQAKLPQQTI